MSNIFEDQTLKGIIDNPSIQAQAQDLIGKCFNLVANPNKEERPSILIFGMNPAGDADTVKEETTKGYFYLNYVKDITEKRYNRHQNRVNNYSLKKIYQFAQDITNGKGGAKWDWCNLDWKGIKNKVDLDINNHTNYNKNHPFYDKNPSYKDNVEVFYNNYRYKRYTIYIGDAFYVHMTSQNNFINQYVIKNANHRNAYVKKMLDLHIEEILNNNSDLKLIYINNGELSDWLKSSLGQAQNIISYDYPYTDKTRQVNIPIIFGCMLSRFTGSVKRNNLVNKAKTCIK